MSKRSISPLFFCLVLVAIVWLFLTEVVQVRAVFLPTIGHTFSKLVSMSQEKELWIDVWTSTYRVLLAFVISCIISYPIVVFSLLNKWVKEVIFYAVEFFRYLPVPVFIPITILWFGIGDLSKIVIVFLGTFAQMIPMFYDSAKSLDNKFDSFVYGLKWSRSEYVKKIIIPGSLPQVFDNARICFGWAWTYLIIAELMGADNGLGYAIIRAQRYLATDRIFSYVLIIGLIGILTDRLMKMMKKELFKWELV